MGISSVNPEFPHEFLEGTFWLTLTVVRSCGEPLLLSSKSPERG